MLRLPWAKLLPATYRRRFMAAMTLVLAVVFAAMVGLNRYFSARVAATQAQVLAGQALAGAAARLEGMLTEGVVQAETLAWRAAGVTDAQGDLQALAEVMPAFVARRNVGYAGIARAATGEFSSLLRTDTDVVRLRQYALRPDGGREQREYTFDVGARLRLASVSPWDGYDPRTRPFYQLAAASAGPRWTPAYVYPDTLHSAPHLGLSLVVPVRDAAGELTAVVDIEFNTATLANFLRGLQRAVPGRLLLVETLPGQPVRLLAASSSETDDAGQVVEWLAAAQDPEAPLPRLVDGRRATVLARAIDLDPLPPWQLLVVVPLDQVVADMSYLDNLAVLALVSVALLGLLLSVLLAGGMGRPLHRLTAGIAGWSDGRWPAIALGAAPDEVVELERAFAQMAERVTTREEALTESRRSAIESAERLRAANDAMIRAAEVVADAETPAMERLRRVAGLAGRALRVGRVLIWTVPPEGGRFDLLAYFDGTDRPESAGGSIPWSDCPDYVETMRRENRVIVTDAATDPRLAQVFADRLRGVGRISLLDVGLRARGVLAGVVSFQMPEAARAWTEEDQFLAGGVADLAALVLERQARADAEARVEAQAERLRRINELVHGATDALMNAGADEMELMRHLTRTCAEALGADRVQVWTLRPGGEAVYLVDRYTVATDAHEAGEVVPTERDTLYWQTLRTEGRVVTEDTAGDPRTLALHRRRFLNRGRVALLDAALTTRGEIAGVFSAHRFNATVAWTPEDQLLMRSMADLASILFERKARREAEGQLQAQASRIARHNAALAAIAHDLGGSLDWTAGLRRVAEHCVAALQVDFGVLRLLEEDPAVFDRVTVFVAAEGAQRIGPPMRTDEVAGLLARLRRERIVTMPDTAADPELDAYFRRQVPELPPLTLLTTAIVSQERVVGLLEMQAVDRTRGWTTEEELFIGAVADVLALRRETLARREAEAELTARSAKLHRLNTALGGLATNPRLRTGQMDVALRELTVICAEALQVERSGLWLMRTAPERLELHNLYRTETGTHETVGDIPLTGHGRYFEALRSERVVAVDDARHDPRTADFVKDYLAAINIRSMLDAPVRSRDEVVGVLCLETVGVIRRWTDDEKLFAGAVSDMVSLILESETRRLAQAEAEESRRRVQRFIDDAPLGVIDWDRHLRVIAWNAAAERMFGHTAAERMGQNGMVLVPPEDKERTSWAWRDLTRGRIGYLACVRNVTKDGRIILCDWHNTVLRDDHGRMIGVTSLIEDVTERVRAEQQVRELNTGLERRVAERTAELQLANERLRELDRLKSEFLATMSHELRTPLNSIIGFSQILKMGMAGPLNDEQKRQTERVHAAGVHLLALINDLLDLSKIEAGRLRMMLETFPARQVAEEVEQMLAPMVQVKGLTFRVVNEVGDLAITSDRSRVFQVLVNLANNAVKFTEQGQVTVRLWRNEERLRIEVIDTGPGIQAENLGRLFEAFRQIDGSARRRYEGTGLGLYLCRKLVLLLGGDIGVESTFGQGSCFHFSLPLRIAARTDSSAPFPSA